MVERQCAGTENVIELIVILAKKEEIEVDLLPVEFRTAYVESDSFDL
ncbi:hypothetical protein [Mucilaginibacter sp.]|nr:hypothetical protein [Mucilaginibacter sp.]